MLHEREVKTNNKTTIGIEAPRRKKKHGGLHHVAKQMASLELSERLLTKR